MLPTRYTLLPNLDTVRKQYGPRADWAAGFFRQGDPLADDLVTEFLKLRNNSSGMALFNRALNQGIGAVDLPRRRLRAFFAEVERVPDWVDRHLLQVGSRAHLRCGIFCCIVLGSSALPLAYRSAAGNKPLIFTGELVARAIRRLSETNRFFIDACLPGGLTRHSPGWKNILKVRLIHGHLRHRLRSGTTRSWDEPAWGVPINQVDMAATQLLFSVTLIQNLRAIGFHFSAAESQGLMHLWRYAGHLMGVHPELTAATETQGHRLKQLLLDVAGGADEHSHQLTATLMEKAMPALMVGLMPWPGWPPRLLRGWLQRPRLVASCHRHLGQFCYGLSRDILGMKVADDLHYPATFWRHVAPRLLRWAVTPLELTRLLLPGGTDLAAWLGHRHLQHLIKMDLVAKPLSI